MSLFLKCPQCGKGPVTTTWRYQTVPYDYPKSKTLTVHVPVRECWACDFQWTDWMAEQLIDNAVQEARRNSQS